MMQKDFCDVGLIFLLTSRVQIFVIKVIHAHFKRLYLVKNIVKQKNCL